MTHIDQIVGVAACLRHLSLSLGALGEIQICWKQSSG
jgi:hypothetical protein